MLLTNDMEKSSTYKSPPAVQRSPLNDLPDGFRNNDDTISTHHSYPTQKPFVNSDYQQSPDNSLSSFPEHNRQAVMHALRSLQDKIRKLEVDRSVAEGNLRSLANETSRYRDLLTQESRTTKPAEQSTMSKQTQELEGQLAGAESRCQLLEKQLDYMRKLVSNTENEKQEALRRFNTKDQLKSYSVDRERQAQLDKIAELEREQLRLATTQSMAHNKIKELEERLIEEKHRRKLIQDKAAEFETVAQANRILYESVSPTLGNTKPKTISKTKKRPKKKAVVIDEKTEREVEMPQHYRANFADIPFLSAQSTGPSYNVGANVQKVLAMMKTHSPALCTYGPHSKKTPTGRPSSWSSNDSSDSDLNDLLLQLQDEFARLSLEHQDLAKQLNEAGNSTLRNDLQRELEELVLKMEDKGEQIGKLKRHMTKQEDKKKRKPKTISKSSGSRGSYYGNGGHVEVTTTIKTKGQTAGPINLRSSRDVNLQKLRDMRKLQTTLRRDDLTWEH